MRETRGHLDFAKKPLRPDLRRYIRAQNLERDRPVVTKVASEKHDGHSAFAQGTLDDVTAGEPGFQALLKVAHELHPLNDKLKSRKLTQ